jgi:hypothetical protein
VGEVAKAVPPTARIAAPTRDAVVTLKETRAIAPYYFCGQRGGSCAAGSVGDVSDSTTVSPVHTDPVLDGDHERMAHIVLEGVETDDGEYIPAGPSVVEGIVNGTPVRALCGKVWVPGRDPKKYPLCPTCKEIAQQQGWSVPST